MAFFGKGHGKFLPWVYLYGRGYTKQMVYQLWLTFPENVLCIGYFISDSINKRIQWQSPANTEANYRKRAHYCSFFTVQKLKSVKELNGRVSVRCREESDKSHPWGGFSLGLQKSARSCCSRRLFPICPCNHNSSTVSGTLIFIYGIICSAAESITLSFAHLKTHFYNFKV